MQARHGPAPSWGPAPRALPFLAAYSTIPAAVPVSAPILRVYPPALLRPHSSVVLQSSLLHRPTPLPRPTTATPYQATDDILVVGDGDFSFSRGLVVRLGSGERIAATNLDTKLSVLQKYRGGNDNITWLQAQKASLGFGIDATKPEIADQIPGLFDVVVFNFPHTEVDNLHRVYDSVESNRQLLRDFFRVMPTKLRPDGEIHVTMKVGRPYSDWEIVQQACLNDAVGYVREFHFAADAYPGYQHRHTNRDASASIAGARTYVFALKASGKCGGPLGLRRKRPSEAALGVEVPRQASPAPPATPAKAAPARRPTAEPSPFDEASELYRQWAEGGASLAVARLPEGTEDEDVLCIFETLPIEGLKLFQLPTGDGAAYVRFRCPADALAALQRYHLRQLGRRRILLYAMFDAAKARAAAAEAAAAAVAG
eukprot:EG_transcript_13989